MFTAYTLENEHIVWCVGRFFKLADAQAACRALMSRCETFGWAWVKDSTDRTTWEECFEQKGTT
jgi:hypothetical protein